MRLGVSALLLSLLAIGSAQAQEAALHGALSTGPLRFADRFVLGLGFLSFEPAAAEVLPKRSWQLDAVWTTANSWAVSAPLELELDARPGRGPITEEQLTRLTRESRDESLIFADGEVSRTVLAIRRGFGAGVELELAVPFFRFSGGWLDGVIETFHDSAGIRQAGRSGAERDNLFIFLTRPGSGFSRQESSSLELGDLVLSAKYKLLDQERKPMTLSLEALVKLPTGAEEPLATSGEADFGAQLLIGRNLKKWSLHASAGVLALGSSELLSISSQTLFSGMFAVERVFGRRTSLVLQGVVSESPFKELGASRVGEPSVQFTAGFKRALGRKNVLLVGFTENLENFNNSADVNFHLGISRALN